jgi:hypothetical protein
MLRRVVSALSRSGEPSGKSGSSFVIRVSRTQSSIRVRRIRSVSVSTRIVSSIVFRPRQSRPSGGGLCDGGGGCIACDRNKEEECAALAPIKPRTVRDGRKKDGVGAVGWRKRVVIRPYLCAVRVIQDCSRITSTCRILTRSAPRPKTASDKQPVSVGRVRLRRSGSRCDAPRAPQIPEESGCRVSAHAGDDPIAREFRQLSSCQAR